MQIINEGWGMMFGQARQQIINLMRENKTNSAQLSDISCQLHETEAINEEIYWHLQDAEKKNQELEIKLDEGLGKKHKVILQEKEQEDIKERDMQCKLQNMGGKNGAASNT